VAGVLAVGGASLAGAQEDDSTTMTDDSQPTVEDGQQVPRDGENCPEHPGDSSGSQGSSGPTGS
jgi:hypothetical protein